MKRHWLALATLALSTAGVALAADLPDIDHAAAGYLTEAWHEGRHRLVRIDLPPGSTIETHRTGPRIIVPLNDATLARSDDGTPVEAARGTGSWLTSRLSRGVRNAGPETASYLALLFPPSNYPPVADDSQGNCSVQGGESVSLAHRPFAGACLAWGSGDEILQVTKWRLVYFETDALMCIGDDCHHCTAGAALYLSKGAAIRPVDGGEVRLVLFRF